MCISVCRYAFDCVSLCVRACVCVCLSLCASPCVSRCCMSTPLTQWQSTTGVVALALALARLYMGA